MSTGPSTNTGKRLSIRAWIETPIGGPDVTPAGSIPPDAATPPSLPLPARIVSIDALRGFDMFWIIGADALVQGLRPLSESRWVHTLTDQLEHVAWEGFHFYDLIFPLFVFLMGAVAELSLRRQVEREGRGAAYRRLVRRTLLLYALGLFYYGGLSQDGGPEMFRWVGVLQRIAICYFFAGLVVLHASWRGLLSWLIVLLVGYGALLTLVPVPGYGAGVFEEGKNLANYIDQRFLPGFKWDGQWDPEGLLSTLGAIATALLGVIAGRLLQGERWSPWQKLGLLATVGLACLGLGWMWSLQLPVIKKIWTSSYVLVAGGWSFLLLSAFYLVIDVAHWQRWARPFVWIGMNCITIYMLANLVDFRDLVRRVIHHGTMDALAPYGQLIVSLLALLLAVGICYELYRHRIFLRV